MSNDFNSVFDNFLTERAGEEISKLREKNKRYGSALSEYSELVKKAKTNEITNYKQAFERLAELGEYIRDTEYRYAFYTGMSVHKKMEDSVSSSALIEMFTE